MTDVRPQTSDFSGQWSVVSHSPLITHHWSLVTGRKGQVALETAVAMIASLFLLLGCVKVFLWINERLIQRQQYYDATRAQASESPTLVWDDQASRVQLNIFSGQ